LPIQRSAIALKLVIHTSYSSPAGDARLSRRAAYTPGQCHKQYGRSGARISVQPLLTPAVMLLALDYSGGGLGHRLRASVCYAAALLQHIVEWLAADLLGVAITSGLYHNPALGMAARQWCTTAGEEDRKPELAPDGG
jgi:hypothetical protein